MEAAFFSSRAEAEDESSCNVTGGAWAPDTSSLLLCAAAGCLSFLISVGNLLVMASVVYFKQLHSATNFLILSLALSDLLVGVVVLPLGATLAVPACGVRRWAGLCGVRDGLDVLLVTSSLLNLGCISIDRYHAVCRPLRYKQKMSAGAVGAMVVATWTVSALLGTGMSVGRPSPPSAARRCVLFQRSRSRVGGAVLAFYFPAALMVGVYRQIWRVALRQARSLHTTNSKVSKSEKKATRTLTVVLGVFLSCWTPFFFCVTISPLCEVPTAVFEALKWLGWSNSVLNPLVYGFFYSWFRSAFRIILSGKVFRGDFSNAKLM